MYDVTILGSYSYALLWNAYHIQPSTSPESLIILMYNVSVSRSNQSYTQTKIRNYCCFLEKKSLSWQLMIWWFRGKNRICIVANESDPNFW